MKTSFLKRVEFNAKNRFKDEFFTSKELAKKMKITFNDVSIALSHLHQTDRIKLIGYTKKRKNRTISKRLSCEEYPKMPLVAR